MKNQSFLARLGNAIRGLQHAWWGERSFRSQVVIGVLALGLFIWSQPSALWWGAIVIAVALVIAAELVNSSIEALADHLHPQQDPAIGKVKDMAAGTVLVMSIAAALVGILAVLDSL